MKSLKGDIGEIRNLIIILEILSAPRDIHWGDIFSEAQARGMKSSKTVRRYLNELEQGGYVVHSGHTYHLKKEGIERLYELRRELKRACLLNKEESKRNIPEHWTPSGNNQKIDITTVFCEIKKDGITYDGSGFGNAISTFNKNKNSNGNYQENEEAQRKTIETYVAYLPPGVEDAEFSFRVKVKNKESN